MNQKGLQMTDAAQPAKNVAKDICFFESESIFSSYLNMFFIIRKKKKKLPCDTIVPIIAIYKPLYKLMKPSILTIYLNAYKSSRIDANHFYWAAYLDLSFNWFVSYIFSSSCSYLTSSGSTFYFCYF